MTSLTLIISFIRRFQKQAPDSNRSCVKEEANIANMGPREREEGAFGEELQPVLKKLRLGEGEKKEVEGEGGELVKGGEGRGVKRRHHPDTECTGATLLTL